MSAKRAAQVVAVWAVASKAALLAAAATREALPRSATSAAKWVTSPVTAPKAALAMAAVVSSNSRVDIKAVVAMAAVKARVARPATLVVVMDT